MELPKRKPTRIPGYDYSAPNYYFVTLCTHNKSCIFGDACRLNAWGETAKINLLKMQELHPELRIDNYVIMPNHIHAIIVIQGISQENGIRDQGNPPNICKGNGVAKVFS